MATPYSKLALAGSIATLVAACSATTSPAPTSGFQIAEPAPAAEIPAPPETAGFQINGESFAGDLIFEDRDGRVVALYRHAVDGAETLVADLETDPAFLVDGVRRFSGLSDRGVDLTVEMVSGPCQAGGRLHARFATVSVGRLVFDGCAREVGPVTSWSEELPRYFSAIEACETAGNQSSMAFARRGGGAVVHARTQGQTAVIRYHYGESGRWECRVDNGRATWSIVPETAGPQPGEGAPRFIPGRIPSAGEGCYLYERVETEDGDVLGALAHDVCTPGFALAPNTRFG